MCVSVLPNALIVEIKKRAQYEATRHKPNPLWDWYDLFQEGCHGFLLAMERYDRSRAKPATYALKRAHGAMLDLIRKAEHLHALDKLEGVMVRIALVEPERRLFQNGGFAHASEQISRAFKRLVPTHQQVLMDLYVHDRQCQEIAKERGCTLAAVSLQSIKARRRFAEEYQKIGKSGVL